MDYASHLRLSFPSDITLLTSFTIAIILTIIHPNIAATLAYISAVWAGEEDPLWPHLVLIPGSVLAGIAVGAGIVFEKPKYSAAVHRVAFWLVVVGVAVESLVTVFLFVVDERISNAQQSRIIALDNILLSEQRLTARERMTLEWLIRAVAPRNITKDRVALVEALKKEAPGRINIAYVDKEEPNWLATQMAMIFSSAGIMGDLITLSADAKVRGVSMYAPNAKGARACKVMWDVTNKSMTRICGSAMGIRLTGLESLPEGENTLVIGENDAAFQPPDGQPGEGLDRNGRPVPAPQ